MAGPVDEKVCVAKHEEIIRRFEVDNKRLNAHSESLVDLKEVVIRLTLLQETSVQTMKDQQAAMKDQQAAMKDQNIAMASIDKRVNELEAQRVKLTEVHMAELDEQEVTFWSTTGGQWIIKGSVAIAVILTLAAIGQNVNPEFLSSVFGK
ncbi:MAG TPA: hypothetical protein VN456_07690 [Desulfosporosinus sp.]|nr:hypothetical protein [Desulfosporosinus sp.]